MSYSTGSYATNAKIHYSKDVTAEEVVAEANKIWSEVKKTLLQDPAMLQDTKRTDELIAHIHREYKDFSKSYPIVIRYMCQMGQYHSKALQRYLIHIKNHPWTTEDSYIESQADYVVMLYKVLHKNYKPSTVTDLHDTVLSLLKKERTEFKKTVEDSDKLVTELEEKLRLLDKEELKEFIRAAGESGMALAETIRVVEPADFDPKYTAESIAPTVDIQPNMPSIRADSLLDD